MTRAAPFGFAKAVFLSHVLTDGTPVFPGDPPVGIRPVATILSANRNQSKNRQS